MEALEKLLELDARHNDLLAQLEELDAKISATLHEWTNSNIAQKQTQNDVSSHLIKKTNIRMR